MNQEFADVEIYIRRPGDNKHGDTERCWTASYEDMARMSNHTVVENVAATTDLDTGEWEIGIRERGDEQYSQRFGVVQPHAENRADALIKSHLVGVLRHWRA